MVSVNIPLISDLRAFVLQEKIKALLVLICVAFIGGAITPALVKVGVSGTHVIIYNLLRSVTTAIILIPFLLQNTTQFKNQKYQKFFLITGIGIALNSLLFSIGIKSTTLFASQLLYALLPLTVSLLAFLFLKEHFNKNKAIGVTISFLGLAILIISSAITKNQLGFGTLTGNLIILTAVLAYTTYIVISKRFSLNLNPLFISATTYTSVSLIFIAISASILLVQPNALFVDGKGVVAGIINGITSTFFIVGLQYGLRKLSSTTTAITTLLGPIFGAFSGIIFFSEQFSLTLLLSLILVLAGVSWSVMGERMSKLSLIKNYITNKFHY